MAKPIREKQFNVQQAAQVATEGSAYDDSGVRLAQSLQSLVSDAGQFGQQISGMYATGKQQDLKEQTKISEDRAYDDLALGLQQDSTFLSKHDTLPPGWTDVKWKAYNTMKANADLVSFSRDLDTARETYLTNVANDPDRSFIQAELDTVYQNTFDKMLRTSNGNGAWMEVFLPRAASSLQQRATADRADRAKRIQDAFKEKSNNSILAAISEVDFTGITPEMVKKSTDYYLSQGVTDPNSTDHFNYARSFQISKAYQENRQLSKTLGFSVDKEAMVNVFKQLASQSEDLTPVMEILLDTEMPGTGLTYGESGQRVELLKVLEDSKEDRSAGRKNAVTVEVFDLIGSNRTETRTQLDTIAKSKEVTSLVNFHDILRNQNIELDKVEEEILKVLPENKSELLKALDRQRTNNKDLISRGNGVYFASQNNPNALGRIYLERMTGEMSDQELFNERKNLKADQYEEFLYMQDELQDANDKVVRAFVKLMGVDPGQRTMAEMMSARLFKPGSVEAVALNSFIEKLASEGTGEILKYYNAYGVTPEGATPTTIQTKLLKDDDVKLLFDTVKNSRGNEEQTKNDNLILYRTEREEFYSRITDSKTLVDVYDQLGNAKERQDFLDGLSPIQLRAIKPYLDI